MNIKELQKLAHETAKSKGWYKKEESVGESIALMHSELSEALEEYRKDGSPSYEWQGNDGKPEGVPSEMADVVIRIASFFGLHGIDLEDVIKRKLEYNLGRQFRHGGKHL